MNTQQINQASKKLTLKREHIHLLTAPPPAQQGPTAIDCSITC